jgi:phosphatidylglycerophosphate synthase
MVARRHEERLTLAAVLGGLPVRPRVSGVAAGLLFVAGGLAWVALARPGEAVQSITWFVLVAVAGAFLPGLANQATLARAYLAGPGVVYALAPHGLPPLAVVVVLAGLTDTADGAIARRLERPTQLGGALDPVVDGIFFGGVAAALAAAGAYPAWLAAVVVLRYAVPALVGAALLVTGRGLTLHHTPFGQLSTLAIAGLLGSIAALRGLGVNPDPLLTPAEVLIPITVAATFGNLALENRRWLGAGPPPTE